jgi:Ca2+-binding RTX toxin-like protein
VTDFSVKDDTLWVENAVFRKAGKAGKLAADAFKIGAKAADAEDRFIYNSKSGAVLYDADGTGSAAAIQVAVLGKGLKLTAADFFVI